MARKQKKVLLFAVPVDGLESIDAGASEYRVNQFQIP